MTDQPKPPSADFLNTAAAAHYIGVSQHFLNVGRSAKRRPDRSASPPYIKLGRLVRYTKPDLDAWLVQCRIDPKMKGEQS